MPIPRRLFLHRSAMTCAAFAAAPRHAFAQPERGRPSWVHGVALEARGFDDLRFLAPLLEGVRIVQLGENGHGEGESMRLRARIAGYLCDVLGYDVLAFESSLFLCHLANSAAESTAQRMLTSSLIGVWHTEEMLPLFERIVRSRGGPRPLALAGFDVQPIGSQRKLRPGFFRDLLAPVDAEAARGAAALDEEFLAAYDKGSSERRAFLRSEGERLAAEYTKLASKIESRLEALQRSAGQEAPLVAKQEARSMVAYIRFQSAPDMRTYAETRDEGMFQNLRFLADELFPGRKIVVWGHNYHLRHDNASIPPSQPIFPGVAVKTMGSWTLAHFGRAAYTVGQYEVSGTAVNNSRKPYAVAPPASGTLEYRLGSLAGGPAFIDLRAATKTDEGKWLGSRVTARYNGEHSEALVPSEQYDALLLLPTVSPPRFLY